MGKNTKEFILSFTEDEIKDREVKKWLNKLIEAKIRSQRWKPCYELSELEVKALQFAHKFVPKEAYGAIKFKGEIGKFNGRRVVLVKHKE
uniref:Uncharacterized protein n=1 Tax=viral metagenome TaxID=1070528 RepID=A0A6M3JH63_9ZZZZ